MRQALNIAPTSTVGMARQCFDPAVDHRKRGMRLCLVATAARPRHAQTRLPAGIASIADLCSTQPKLGPSSTELARRLAFHSLPVTWLVDPRCLARRGT